MCAVALARQSMRHRSASTGSQVRARDSEQQAYRPLAQAQLIALPGMVDAPSGLVDYWIDRGEFRRHVRGTKIHAEGQAGDVLTLVIEGVVTLGRALGTRDAHILAYLGPGTMFGVVPLVDGGPHQLDAVVHDPALLLSVPLEDVRAAWQAHPAVRRCFELHLARHNRLLNQRVIELATMPLASRISRLLCRMAHAFGVPRQNEVVISLRLSQDNVAKTVGASRQQVNAVLKRFSDLGLISVSRESITLRNIAALECDGCTTLVGGGSAHA